VFFFGDVRRWLRERRRSNPSRTVTSRAPSTPPALSAAEREAFAKVDDARRLEAAAVPMGRMEVDDYRRLIAGLPRPSPQQMSDFAEYISTAHSWYKGMRTFPPWPVICIHLDPLAGHDRVLSPDGSIHYRVRADRGFHHKDIPTADHLRRFGHLVFCHRAGPSSGAVIGDGGEVVKAGGQGPALYDPECARRSGCRTR